MPLGIDVHALNFLRFASREQPLGEVATIGRQALNVPPFVLKRHLHLEKLPDFGPFCEDLLYRHFRAISVESYDNSSYENATYVRNMNKELQLDRQYDTVFDGGCLEHIYNAPQALLNVSNMCRPGGQILHVLPANNFCGHGFWQFSPELFFSLYSEKNGYLDTRVFVADLLDTESWYEVQKPENGRRAHVDSSTSLYLLVRTKRGFSAFSHSEVQQSDYVQLWTDEQPAIPRIPTLSGRLARAVQGSPLAPIARHVYRRCKRWSAGLKSVSGRNPRLIRHSVSSLV
jgi:SAM-dependent methyltransferase